MKITADVLMECKKPLVPDKIRRYQYGVVYSDPSNADPSFDALRYITTTYPRVDIIINLAAASYKERDI